MARAQAAKGKAPVAKTATLRLQDTDMEEKMKKFEKTLIGRLLNPEIQRMDLLIENFPKIWKLQDKLGAKLRAELPLGIKLLGKTLGGANTYIIGRDLKASGKCVRGSCRNGCSVGERTGQVGRLQQPYISEAGIPIKAIGRVLREEGIGLRRQTGHPPLYQAKPKVTTTGGEVAKTDNKSIIGNTARDAANPNMVSDNEDNLTARRGDKGLEDDEVNNATHNSLAKEVTEEENNAMEGVEGQGENLIEEMGKENSPEQGFGNISNSGTNNSLALDSVSKALEEIELKPNSKKSGLPGRKYSTVVLASPKKRMLLNRMYGSIKQQGKDIKNKPFAFNRTLVNKDIGDSGNTSGNKGGKAGSGTGKRGPSGRGIPKPSSKK
ncbi:unnamed protein product [Cochlearia groenlandica]